MEVSGDARQGRDQLLVNYFSLCLIVAALARLGGSGSPAPASPVTGTKNAFSGECAEKVGLLSWTGVT